MKRFLFVFAALIMPMMHIPAAQEQPELRILSEFKLCPNDKDASMSYKMFDLNDELCALVKVTLTNPLSNRLTMTVTNATPVSKEIEGQMWFWIPHWIKNISFSCLGYKPTEPKGVSLEAGKVYAVTVGSNVDNVVIPVVRQTSGYLHFKFNIPNVKARWGKSSDMLDGRQNADAERMAIPLEYGRYTFLFEDPEKLYKSETRVVDYDGTVDEISVELEPSFNYLSITSYPGGAKIYVDDDPYESLRKYPAGRHEIYAQLKDYSMKPVEVFLNGDGSTVAKLIQMNAKFGTVEVKCSDPEAELYLDGYDLGTSSWNGNVSSGIPHVLEAKKKNHRDQSTGFTLKDGEIRTVEVSAPIPIYASLDIQSTPSFCQVYLDDELLGETPIRKTVLSGSHTVKFKRSGYLTKSVDVYLSENEMFTLTTELEKGKLYARVRLNVQDPASKIVFMNGLSFSGGSWEGKLPEGQYTVYSRKEGCKDGVLSFTVEGSTPMSLVIPDPEIKKGTLHVKTNVPVSHIYADGQSIGWTDDRKLESVLPEGRYGVYASASGYESSATSYVDVPYASDAYLDLHLARKLWIKDDMDGRPKFSLEVTYGHNFAANTGVASRNYIGFNTDYAKHRIGFHISGMYGFDRGDFGFTAGPELRFGRGDYGSCDCHLFGGVGYYHSGSYNFDSYAHLMGDFGIRLGIRNALSDDFSWLSLSLGAKCSRDFFIPQAGMSIMIVPLIAALEKEQEDAFGWAFLDGVAGYDGDWYVGGSFTWLRTHIGLYGTYMKALNADPYSLTGGLAFRLTSDRVATDIQLYTGVGTRRRTLTGDFGARFIWNPYKSKFFTIGLQCGAQFSKDSFMPTFGFSFTLLGEAIATACTAGLLVPAFIPR